MGPRCVERSQRGPHIESGTSDQERPAGLRSTSVYGLLRPPAVLHSRPLLLRIGNCDQFVLYATGLLEPGLVSQDGEALVELHGVAGNNRDPEALRHFHGHSCLLYTSDAADE